MTEHLRIEELRRRVEKDPTSIAFAQLAEEYRRSGDYLQAVKICRDGLARHPGYLSAQVTLGRSLMELGEYVEARRQLQTVLQAAPDNLAAIRALAEIHQSHRKYSEAPTALVEAPPPASTVAEPAALPAQPEPPKTEEIPDLPPVPDFDNWTFETDFAIETPEAAFAAPPLDRLAAKDPALEHLEQWLAAIVADRCQSR